MLYVRIFAAQEQLNTMLGFCTVLCGGLLGSETVSAGTFDACAVSYYFTLFLLYPYSVSSCRIATTACSIAALPSLSA